MRRVVCSSVLPFLLIAVPSSPLAALTPLEEAQRQFDAHLFAEARHTLEPAAADSPEARILMARICNSLGDWECGLEHGKGAIAALPTSSQAQLRYAQAIRIKMQNVSKMKAMFSLDDYKEALARAIELDGGNVDAREEEIGFLINAPGFAGRDLRKARERIDELEAVDWRRGMRMRAELAHEEDDPTEAERIYARILDRDPGDAGTRLSYGFFCLGQERWRDASEQFSAIGEDAEPRYYFAALYQLGRTRVLGRFEAARAVEYFDRYIASVNEGFDVPSRSNAYWRQGMAYELLDREDDARGAYREALRLDPSNKEAKQALRKLGS